VRGFTLLESLITMAILAIVVAISIPSMAALVARHRTVSNVNQLITHMHLTRSTAITRRASAVLCPSLDGQRCQQGTDWSHGWIVFTDPDGDYQPGSSSDVLLSESRGDGSGITVHSSAGRTRLRYRPDGLASGTNLTLSLCRSGQLVARVVVNNTGRPRSEISQDALPCPA
jgi:type IV fimbrial biogenesis protein FimT